MLAATLLSICAQALPADDAIQAAIERGARHLIRTQLADGSWGMERAFGAQPGQAALRAWALVKAGLPAEHPTLQRALAFIDRRPADATYGLATSILARAELGREHATGVERDVARLLASQSSGGLFPYSTGGMNHFLPADLSNSLFAALAMRSAEKVGLDIPRERWTRLLEGTLEVQEAMRAPTSNKTPRGFRYRDRPTATGSMTTAGLTVLACVEDALGGFDDETAGRVARARRDAHDWLEAFGTTMWSNPRADGTHHLYWLWGQERIGALEERERVAGKDWYREGAKVLLATQEQDGRWQRDGDEDTALALLFLSRATRSVRGAARLPRAVYATADDESALRLRARVDGAVVAVWVDGIADRVRGTLGEQFAVDSATLVASMAGAGPLEEPFEETLHAPRDETRFQFELPRSGRAALTVELEVQPATTTTPVRLRSAPLEVDVLLPPTETALDYASDIGGDLLLARSVRVQASSSTADGPPGLAIDGELATAWRWDASDAEPWLRIELDEPVRVKRIRLTAAEPSLARGGAPNPRGAIVRFESGHGAWVAFDPDPLVKTEVRLGSARRVRWIEIRLPASDAEPRGLAAVELFR